MEVAVMAGMIRLDKFLAEMKKGTRSQVKEAVRKGRVTVDGAVCRSSDFKFDPEVSGVCMDGEPVSYARMEYFMLNKPQGVVSATEDNLHPTVISLIGDAKRKDLFPVGRLDIDTEGLLLITNDGKLAHELLSPKKHVDKVYYARIRGNVTEMDVEQFRMGVDIGENRLTLPAKLEILCSGEDSEIRLTIREGKFHQVKRMFQSVGKEVTYLKRLQMGSLMLDESLKPGEYRTLTRKELDELC